MPSSSANAASNRLATQIASRVDEVRSRIAAAAAKSGRDASSIRLLPVTKYVDEDHVRIISELGFRDLAESQVQSLRTRSAALEDLSIDWVLIGHLQRNKAGQAARIVSEVQSVDSLRIANALDSATQRALDDGSRQAPQLKVLLQVNTSGEEAKYGLSPHEVSSVLESVAALPHLRVAGFMTMAPFTEDEDVVRRTFADLADLSHRMQEKFGSDLDLKELSMGMSNDYEVAIEEGATTVRIGSALFSG